MNIPYGRQDVNEDDINAVIKVLKSDYLTQGSIVPKFESAVASYVGAKHSIAVNSATSALHIACKALDVRPGDSVWTSPITFVASANCALYCGAKVDFVDIDPITYNLSVSALTKKLEEAEKSGNLPKVLIPVHLSGQSCDMKGIYNLSLKYGFKIIEDASHAIGGMYLEKRVGSCSFSNITIFSFHPVKIITTGEGGMAVTNDSKLAEQMYRLRSHGITRHLEEMQGQIEDGDWYYQQIDLGFNYRMTDIQAALGLSQLERIDEFVEKRHTLANRYNNLFKDISIILPFQNSDCYSSFHLYIIRIPTTELFNRQEVFERLRSHGIGVNVHYIPVYRQPYYKQFNFDYSNFPEAESYYSQAITIPLFPTLTEEQQDIVAKVLAMPIGHQALF
jgi:UDP-4-amino-4,6-dideoxy-N-acetyl-beta-L-altrosamine transaminase